MPSDSSIEAPDNDRSGGFLTLHMPICQRVYVLLHATRPTHTMAVNHALGRLCLFSKPGIADGHVRWLGAWLFICVAVLHGSTSQQQLVVN